MVALVKYADSDSTKDPDSDEEKPGKGKKSGSAKGQQHNTAGHGGNSKRKAEDGSDFAANTNTPNNNHRKKGKPSRLGGPKFNLEAMMNQPCPKHGTHEKPANYLWKDCLIMREYKNSIFSEQSWPEWRFRIRLSRAWLWWRRLKFWFPGPRHSRWFQLTIWSRESAASIWLSE